MVEKSLSKKQMRKHRGVVAGIVIFVVSVLIGFVTWFFWAFDGVRAVGIKFNLESGFYDDGIELEIATTGFSMKAPLAIRYNMNGDSLNDTYEEYNGKIRLDVPDVGYYLYTVTAIVCDGDRNCTEPVVATYVIGRNLDEDVTLSIVSVNCSQYDLYDYYYGIMVGGATLDLYSNMVEDGGHILGNYNNRGNKWLRNAYITVFNPDGAIALEQKALIGISGFSSSLYSVKSMSVTMPAVDEADESEEGFLLRSGSQDQFSGNIRSSVINRLIEDSNFDGGNTTERIVVFLNGKYYGIFDKQMNYSKVDLSRMFDLDKKNKIIKNKGSEASIFDSFGIGNSAWDDLNEKKNREMLEKKVDMENFLRYYAIQMLINNTDWPTNNYVAWKYKGKRDETNKYTDGRLRFLLRDTDLTYYTDENINWFEGVKCDIFEALMENKYNGAGSIFPKVMESEYYRNRFIEILRELINGPFRTENVLKIIDEEAAKINHQVELWSTPEEYEEWKYWIEVLRGAAASREQ